MTNSEKTKKQLTEELEQLRQYADGLENILQGTNVGSWEWNIQTGETVFNEHWAEIVGYTLDELEPVSIKTWEELTHPEDLKQSDELLDRHFSGELPFYYIECRMKHKDGHWVWVHNRGRVVSWTDDGKPLIMYGSHADITERKQAEKTLMESEKKARAVFNQTFQFMGFLDCSGTLLEVNQTALEFAGVEEKDVLGKPFWETIWWTHSAELQNKLYDAIEKSANGQFKRFEVTHPVHDGTIHQVDFSLKPVRDDFGKITYLVAEGHDITQRKRTEEALQESHDSLNRLNSMLRLMCDNLPELIWAKDLQGRFMFANKSCCEDLLGARDVHEPVGKTDIYFAEREKQSHPENPGYHTFGVTCADSDRIILETKNVVRSDESGNIRGKYAILDITKSPFWDENGKLIGTVGCARNVTKERGIENERKRMEKALRESEERFKRLSNLTFEGILIHNRGVAIDLNESLIRTFGYAREEMIGKNLIELTIPQEYHAKIRERIVNNYVEPYEVMARKKDGTLFPIEIESRNIENKGEEYRVTAIRDITDRKKAEKALRESEERFRAIFETAEDSIFIKDCNFKYTQANPAMENLFGMSVSDIIGKTDSELFGEEAGAHIREVDTRVLNGEILREEHTKPVNDVSVTFNVIKVPMRDTSGKIIGLCGIARDITETKRLQELESRAERLETAGTIAGQVAHDFNNLLGPIMAYPDIIRSEFPHDHKAQAYLDDIEDAAKKIADINQDLLTMGRRGHYNQVVIDLNRIVLHVAKEMESRTNMVTCETNLCKDLMNIKGGGAQIHRMLTNLLVNAEDAMEDMGQVSIKTENYYADDTSVAYGRVPKGEYVKLTISDTGCGIPDDIIQKILDPFFSTKTTDKKRGSGLGLSIVSSVIKDHNGYLDMSSAVGHGTSFYLYFPVTREDAGKGESEQVPGGTETVLVVDDDEIQRDVSTRLLRKLGYKVTTVESGEKAIELLRENPQDLVLLDMVMPGGIDGVETYRRILEINPNQQAIIVSGFLESDHVFEAQKLGVGAFVKKPITKKTIAAAVRTELDREVRITVH